MVKLMVKLVSVLFLLVQLIESSSTGEIGTNLTDTNNVKIFTAAAAVKPMDKRKRKRSDSSIGALSTNSQEAKIQATKGSSVPDFETYLKIIDEYQEKL